MWKLSLSPSREARAIDDDLLAEITSTHRSSKPGKRCSVCMALEAMDDDVADTFLHAMQQPVEMFGNFAIGDAMRARGYDVSNLMISRCRRGHRPWTTNS